MAQLRREVLKQFKNLHRARQSVFEDDHRALREARRMINEEFKKNSNVSDTNEIEKLVKIAKDVEVEIKLNVVQAVEKTQGVFQVKVKPHTPFLDNIPFNEDAIIKATKDPKCGSI